MFFFIPMVLQLLLIIHVIRNGKNTSWIFILIFLPAVGAIAYFIIEILPSLKTSGTTANVADSVIKMVNPTRRLKELEQSLKYSDTITNRIDYADELFTCGYYEKSSEVYETCLVGMFKNNEDVKLKLARAYFCGAHEQKALDLLSQIKNIERVEDKLLLIRTKEKLEPIAAVEKEYKKLFNSTMDFETGYHYARFQKNNDRLEDSKKIISAMEESLKIQKRYKSKLKKGWLSKAKREFL